MTITLRHNRDWKKISLSPSKVSWEYWQQTFYVSMIHRFDASLQAFEIKVIKNGLINIAIISLKLIPSWKWQFVRTTSIYSVPHKELVAHHNLLERTFAWSFSPAWLKELLRFFTPARLPTLKVVAAELSLHLLKRLHSTPDWASIFTHD